MKEIDETTDIINLINLKVKRINNEKKIVVDMKNDFLRNPKSREELLKLYNNYINLIDGFINKITELNKLVINHINSDYPDLIRKWNNEVNFILEDLKSNNSNDK